MNKFLLGFCLAIPAFAQNANIFTVSSGDVSLSANGTTSLTVQQPPKGAKMVHFLSASAACDTQAFTVTQAINGAAATTTAATVVSIAPILGTPTPTASSTAWSASNVGAGTAVWSTGAYASGIALLDLSSITMNQVGTNSNYTITVTNTGMSTCTARISIKWAEGDLLNSANQSIPQ